MDPTQNIPQIKEKKRPRINSEKSNSILPSSSQASSPVSPFGSHRPSSDNVEQIKIDESFIHLSSTSPPINSKLALTIPYLTKTCGQLFRSCHYPYQSHSRFYNPQSSGTLSLLQQKLSLSNQYITGISQRYTQRIAILQDHNKTYRQKINEYEQKGKLLQVENQKNQKEVMLIKQKLELLQNENIGLSKKITQFQNLKREFEFLNFNKEQESSSNQNQRQLLKKKLQNRQKRYKQLIEALNDSYIKVQQQKQSIAFQYKRLQISFEDEAKRYDAQMKEKQKQFNHQKEMLLRQIHKLENKLKQKLYKTSILQTGNKELQKSIELQKSNDEVMRTEIQHLTSELNAAKESLQIAESSLNFAKQEIKALINENETFKKLKVKLNEKDELITILREKITQLESIIDTLQAKFNEQTEVIQHIEASKEDLIEEKKDLHEKIETQKQSITKLINQVEYLQHKSQLFNAELNQKTLNFDKQREEFDKISKELMKNQEKLIINVNTIERQLIQEMKKSSNLQESVGNLKVKSNNLSGEIFRLNAQKLSMSLQLSKLAIQTSSIDQKKNMLESQVIELKQKKELKQSMYSEQLHTISKRERQKDRKIECLQENIQMLNDQLSQLIELNKETNNQLANRQIEIQELNQELYELREQKLKIEQNLGLSHYESFNNQIKVNELIVDLQQLKRYTQDLETHINELDNILVWNFEEGRGESNNFQQRKSKMEQIVRLLQEKMKEIEKLTKEKYEKELTIDQLNQTIDDYKSLIEKFTEKLESFLNEKDNLTKMIEDIEVNNKKLAEKLTTYKQKQVEWLNKERLLNRKLKWKQDEILAVHQQKNVLLTKKQTIERQGKDKELKIEQLVQQNISQKEKGNSFKQMVEKLTTQRRKLEDESNKKIKALTKQLQAMKKELEEKNNSLGQLQLDKKQQIALLNNQLSTLKSQMKDFSTFYDSQKFNFMKRNLLLIDLGTGLTKFEKANGIKSNLTSSLKQILKKMEQFDNNSSKLFAKYDKFEGRKQN